MFTLSALDPYLYMLFSIYLLFVILIAMPQGVLCRKFDGKHGDPPSRINIITINQKKTTDWSTGEPRYPSLKLSRPKRDLSSVDDSLTANILDPRFSQE